jgi:hypothetical protein
MATRTKLLWLKLPFVALFAYWVWSPHLDPGTFAAKFFASAIIFCLGFAYFLIAFPAIDRLSRSLNGPPPLPHQRTRSVEDRLDELERLKRRDMVTPEEYAAKRQEILKDL